VDHDATTNDEHADRPGPDEGGGSTDLRLGDADRAAALDALGKHLEAGRLDVDEFGERSVHASMAVRCSDLRPLFADLPAPHPPLPRPPAPESLVPAPRRADPPTAPTRVPQRHHPGLPPARRAGVLAAAVALPVMLILAAGPGSGGLLLLPLLLVLLGGLRHGGPGGPGHGPGHGHGPGNRW
jgi:hypothetical protein